MGRAQARLLAPYLPPFRRWAWEREPGFLDACARLVRDVHEPLWEELCAFAASHGMPETEGLFVRASALPHGCSSFAWRLPDDRVVVGRNYDFHAKSPTRDLLRTQPAAGHAHVGMCGGLVGGRYDGVNSAGLFVALHKVMADRPPRYAPGVPYHLIPRLALELTDTAADAARLIGGLPHLAPFNYLVADPGGTFVGLECYPGEAVRARRSHRALAMTNHYRHGALASKQGRRSLTHSRRRLARLSTAPGGEDGSQDGGEGTSASASQAPVGRTIVPARDSDALAPVRDALRDHDAPVCNHGEMGATLWSAAADLTQRRLAYAFGPPCEVEYQVVPFPER